MPTLDAKRNVHLLELFHGPTFAFKDVALQFLGNLFEYTLAKHDAQLNIFGATSGRTDASDGTTFVVNPVLFAKVPYDPYRDFAPITMVASTAILMALANSQRRKVAYVLGKSLPTSLRR